MTGFTGASVSITDHNGRTVRYEWGSMGQREGMIYPDGTKISWKYDSLLRPVQMNRTAAGRDPLWTQYQYDGQGRLSEKRTSGGYTTRWQYDETGLLGELSHTDASGILDRFQYTYDAAGNKTAIRKERRGFPEESGSYQYAYDGLHRLTGVEKDGKPLRSYQYDTFGNRTVMEDCTRGIMTVSEYDALNHLIRQEISKDAFPEDTIQKTYTYDKRGNLTGEYQDGDLLHGYAFNSMNRLEKAWDSEGTEAEYFYNALGQRTARSTAGETEEYLLDLTKPYHNLLELQKGKHRQTFYWDMNVSAMEDENRTLQYYLQDELGSPLRVLYRSGSGAAYGYDEFGADLYDPEKKTCAGRQYSRQGEHQPFGFTGYRYDDISGTYFAQAREYQPGVGRFTAEDILRSGSNWYMYCNSDPLRYTDPLGLDAILINKKVDNIMGDALGVEHMGAFFQDENDEWYFFYWGDKVKYEKVEDPNIFDSMDSMNNYLYDHDLYAMENKPYIDSVYIKGDFTLSHQKAIELENIYNNAGKEFNGKYNLLWRNCGQVTMRLFSQGVLPSGMKVSDYMLINGYMNAVIPNWNMINMQNIFHNSALNLSDFNKAMQQLYDQYEKHPIWYFYQKNMLDLISGCAE